MKLYVCVGRHTDVNDISLDEAVCVCVGRHTDVNDITLDEAVCVCWPSY